MTDSATDVQLFTCRTSLPHMFSPCNVHSLRPSLLIFSSSFVALCYTTRSPSVTLIHSSFATAMFFSLFIHQCSLEHQFALCTGCSQSPPPCSNVYKTLLPLPFSFVQQQITLPLYSIYTRIYHHRPYTKLYFPLSEHGGTQSYLGKPIHIYPSFYNHARSLDKLQYSSCRNSRKQPTHY